MDNVWQHFINAYSLPNTNSKHCKEKALVESSGKAAISSPARATWGFMGKGDVIMAWTWARAKGITGCWSLPRLTNGIPDVTDAPSHLFICFTWHCTVAGEEQKDHRRAFWHHLIVGSWRERTQRALPHSGSPDYHRSPSCLGKCWWAASSSCHSILSLLCEPAG